MQVVVVGKGGREHAIAQKLKSSPLVSALFVCPGNPGMEKLGLQCTGYEQPDQIYDFCVQNKIDLVVIGPEAAILSDLKIRLEEKGIACFAPSKEVAQLESSKKFCKQILIEAQVPTAKFILAQDLSEANQAISAHDFSAPLVLKADGLAAGKGVWVCDTESMAQEGLAAIANQFGFPILLEECLIGKELSAFALCDGKDFVILGTACDYKRVSPDPFSANTGGMGAYSPCDFTTSEDEIDIQKYFHQTLQCLAKKDLPFQGFLFMGLMKTEKGLFVLEYNVRMGDPETQALMPRLESDLAGLIMAATQQKLKGQACRLSDKNSVHVVVASQGYPQAQMLLNQKISYKIPLDSDCQIYFAGVTERSGKLINSGGRVLGITALTKDRIEARQKVYESLKEISFEGMYFRRDIGQ